MTLKAAVGIDYAYIEALTLALNNYNQDDARKQFHKILVTSTDATTTVTIVYSTADPTPEERKKEEEKFHYIGSTDIDPNDPDWMEKWKLSQGIDQESLDAEWRLNTDPIHDAPTSLQ